MNKYILARHSYTSPTHNTDPTKRTAGVQVVLHPRDTAATSQVSVCMCHHIVAVFPWEMASEMQTLLQEDNCKVLGINTLRE